MAESEKVFYPNLVKAMKDKNVTKTDLATLLGVHFNTITDKIEGRTTSDNRKYNVGFTFLESLVINRTLFKEYDIVWLFDCETVHSVTA